MMKAKVLLVLPNSRWYGKRPWLFVPFTALILTALLRDAFDFSIIDANGEDLSEDECRQRIRRSQPDILLISAMSFEYRKQFHAVLAMAKEVCPQVITVAGGVHPTVLGEEMLQDSAVDYIFLGHAEERIEDFLIRLLDKGHEQVKELPGIGFRETDGQIRINPVQSYIGDVPQMVQPDYSVLDLEPYLVRETRDYQINSSVRSAPLLTSYGCPYNCLFCATRTISGYKVAYRSIEDVLAEIEFLVQEYGVQELAFIDDCFLADRQRVEQLLNALIEKKLGLTWKAMTVSAWHLDDELLELMAESGCRQITISVESGCERVLHKIIRKPLKLEIIPPIIRKCNQLEIDIGANFVIGFPGETWDEIRSSINFAEECNFDLVHFHIATPLPETDLYKIALDQGLLPEDFSFSEDKYFGFCRGVIETEEFTPRELMILRSFEWDRINFKTPEKTAKVAEMYNVTLEGLSEHRRQTRREIGVAF